MTHAGSFPHPLYAHHILEPGFRHAAAWLFPHMMIANEAQALMLAATGIIPAVEAVTMVDALRTIRDEGAGAFAYEPAVEDLFFAVERRLIDIAGPEAGGNLQIARSRNDLAAALGRMEIRERILDAVAHLVSLRTRLIDLAETHAAALMPGITHTQPAQPTTLGHQLLGVVGALERDVSRLRDAYGRVNRSPLGAAAFTTTSFPIDRALVASLLGFDGTITNGYDAVGAGDHLLESVNALQVMAASLSRFVYDLLVWTRAELGVLRVDDAFIQISSIMPQKRNPVVLEHIRIRLGYVFGDANTVATILHSSAFGDTNDVEDQAFVPVMRAFAASVSAVDLLEAVLASATFDTALLERRAAEGNMTVTALADGLVRDHGLSFRAAHHVVSALVSAGSSFDAPAIEARVRQETGRGVSLDQAWIEAQLDPRAFVEARVIDGGPAPAAMARAIGAARATVGDDQAWVAGCRVAFEQAAMRRDDALARLRTA